ncbi:transcriptional regulator [Granulicella cerasi]|uniref:Transcriptional regulator n=1 Tax=Granulicella cerasi TaxID=741063 RepID=A0ABW1Z4M0_9BACT|nr:transcriptional regulator [Granulicella cerasi]
MNAALHTELWTSWAAVLRSYAAAHGLNAPQHAVVEVSAEKITLRVGSRWLAFTPEQMETSEGAAKPFALHEDGTVSAGDDAPEEMDFAAERLVRGVMFEE